MSVRKCLTCKHYDPSPIWRKGWCRNPLLYSPQQSHLVDQDDLDCSRGLGNYWEPAETETRADDPPLDRQRPETARPFRLFARQPQLAPAAAGAAGGMVASSSSGGSPPPSGGSPSSGSSRPPGSPTPRGAGGTPGGQSPPSSYGGATRPGRPGTPPGQERIVSYQPEERYWTDYLRIALPVVGLLLMLGLFWYWASALIGDDDDEPPPTTPAVELTFAPTLTPTTATSAGITPEPATRAAGGDVADEPTPTGEAADPTATTAAEEPTPTEEAGPSASDRFAVGDLVQVNDNDVRMRSEPSTESDANIIGTLALGTELEITGPAVEGSGFIWWPVRNPATEEEGFVAEDLLDPA